MRLDGQHLDVHRQPIPIGDDVLARARRDVDRLAAQPQADRRSRRRVVGEEEADGHADALALSRSAAGAAARRGRCPARAATACPPAPDAAPVPASSRAAVLPDSAHRAPCCRRSPARDRARRADATTACDRRRGWRGARRARCPDEIRSRGRIAPPATGIGITKVRNTSVPSAGTVIRLRHADDEIGRAELPAVAPVRQRRQRRRVALRRAVRDPLLQRLELGIGQAALALKVALPGDRLPRRHDPPRGHRRDLRRVPPHIVVGDQAERADLSRPMARRAAGPDDRRDVFGEGEPRLRLRERRPAQRSRSEETAEHAEIAEKLVFLSAVLRAGLAYQRCLERSPIAALAYATLAQKKRRNRAETAHRLLRPIADPLSRRWRRRPSRGSRSRSSASRCWCGWCTSGRCGVAVLLAADGRLARLRRVGAADRRRRLARPRGLLPGAALSLSARRHLRGRRPSPAPRPHRPGGDRIGVVRAARAGRGAAVLAPRRRRRRPDAGALRARDFLRRPAAEIGARRLLRLPGALADVTIRRNRRDRKDR